MIQLSFAVPGSVALPSPPAPLEVAPHPVGHRVSGVWRDTDLATARSVFADFLSLIAPDVLVLDLLTGRSDAAERWVARLRAAPDATSCLWARHWQGLDQVWIRLFGLYQLGLPDIVLGVAPDVSLEDAYALVTSLGAAQLTGTRFVEDKPMAYGYWQIAFGPASLADEAFWALLRDGLQTHHLREAFAPGMATPAPRFVIEAAEMGPSESERWLIGGSHALRAVSAQRRALGRWEVERGRRSPSAKDAAIICVRLTDEAGWFAYRQPPQREGDSGWHAACLDPTHVHDATTTRITTVEHLVSHAPELAQYLALPPGWVVSRDGEGWWVQPAGADRSYRDEGVELGAPWAAASELSERQRRGEGSGDG